VWKALEPYGEVEDQGNAIVFKADAAKCASIASKIKRSRVFNGDTNSADKKGWNWSGDTDISIYSFTAPSLAQALVETIVMFSQERGCGTFETARDELHDSDTYKRWQDLWDFAVSGYETSLKKQKGRPDKVVRLINDGNDRLTLARQGSLYYLIDFATS